MVQKLFLTILILLLSSSSYATDWTSHGSAVATYLLDEISGDALDSTASHDGTVTGATPNQAGVFGTSYQFSAGNDEINADDIGFLSSFTIVLHVKTTFTTIDKYFGMVSRGAVFEDNTNFCFGMRYMTPTVDRIFCYARVTGGALGSEVNAGNLSDGSNFNHIAVSWASGSQIFYANGVSQGTASATNGGDGSQILRMGRPNSTTSADAYFPGVNDTGYMDEVGVFSAVMSSTDINDMMDNGLFEAGAPTGAPQVMIIMG